jgi:hypothetical protein
MKRKRPLKIVLFAVLIGTLVFALSCAAQFLRERQLQASGWLICPGYISAIFNSAFVHGTLGILSSSALLLLLHRRNGKLSHVGSDA